MSLGGLSAKQCHGRLRKTQFVQLSSVTVFFEIVAVSQILKTLEIIDITTCTLYSLAIGVYWICFAYKVKILMILTYPKTPVL